MTARSRLEVSIPTASADGKYYGRYPHGDAITSPFPIGPAASNRSMVNAGAQPWPLLGRTAWDVISLSVTNYQAFIANTLSYKWNLIECAIPFRDPRSTASPFCGNGAAPFLKLLDGSTWDGTFTYGTNSPDFTTPNPTYWGFVDTFISYCESQSILVNFFPAYVGYNSTDQGWMPEMLQNGATKMQTYGAFIANRYKNNANIVWMLGGDKGTSPITFSSPETAVEAAFITGLKSVSGQKSQQEFSAEWQSPSIGTDQTDFGGDMTINSVYSWEGLTGTYARQAWAHSPTLPAFLDEEPYDQEGPDGNNANPNATQPVRRFNWWGWLNSIGGYCAGNGFVWLFNSGYTSHLNTQGAIDCGVLNNFILSIPFQRLIPDGESGIGTLITANAGTIDTMSYVAAAATALGDLLVVYASPSRASTFTIDATKLRGAWTGLWVDPTSGATSSAGSGANTGTHVFTVPVSNNSAGGTDWALKVTA